MSNAPPLPEGFDPAASQPLNVPTWAVSQVAVQATSNEIMIIGIEAVPGFTREGGPSPVARLSPTVLLRISPQTAKDLSIILSDTVTKYEEIYGVLTTDFTKMRQK